MAAFDAGPNSGKSITSEFFGGINIPEDMSSWHDISSYEQTANILGLKPTGYIGGGAESIAMELADNKVLKFTEVPVDPLAGTRPFDLPLLSQGKVTLEAGTSRARDIYYQIQPKVSPISNLPDSMARQMEAKFASGVSELGYHWADPSPGQLGLHEGSPHLIDYFSVVSARDQNQMVDPTTPGLRPAVEQTVHQVPGISKTQWEADKELVDRIGDTLHGKMTRNIIQRQVEADIGKGWMLSTAAAGYRGRQLQAFAHEELRNRGFTLGEADQLGRMPITKMPVPVMPETAPAAVAAKIAVGETIAETHVNLEGKTGGWLKKVMKLPFLKHSRLDIMASAVQAQQMSATKRPFNVMSYAGILLGGVLSLGASFTLAGWQTINHHVKETRVDVDSTPTPVDPNKYNAPIYGTTESFTTKRMEQASPGGSTNIHITDADLDGDSLDRAFASHLKSGFAHG